MLPTVSVQIVTFNSEREILRCLESVFTQTYPLVDVFIIDNNSQDETLKLLGNVKNIHIIKNDYNNGFAGGHNQGFKLTNTDYVLVLNPDVCLHKDYVKNIVNNMERDKRIGMATGKLYKNIGKQILDSTGIIMRKNRRAFDRGSGEIDNGQYDDKTDVFGVSGAAAIYSRAMIDEVSIKKQFYDETFFAYKEDVDVSWRAQIYGWHAIFVPNAVAEHVRGWNESKSRTDISLFIRQKSYINRFYYILKNDQFSYYLLHLPIILLYEVPSLLYALLREPKLIIAWKLFIIEYKKMMEKRREIIMKKKVPNKVIYSYFKGIW